jgi:hypothetical protein
VNLRNLKEPMNESLYNQLSNQELLSLILKTIDEYILLSTATSNARAIEEKRIELFKIYEIIKERGIVFENDNLPTAS